MGSLGEEEKKNNERKQNEKQPREKKRNEREGQRDRGGEKMQKGHKAEGERKIMKALKDRSVSMEIYSKKMRRATSR